MQPDHTEDRESEKLAAIRHGLHAWKGWKEIKSSEISCTTVTRRGFFFFLLPHYFTTEAKKPNPTFGSDDKCTKWMLSPAGNTCQDYNKGWILSPHPHLPLHHLSHRGAGSPSAASAYSHTDTNINTQTQAKTHTCIDRKPVAKLGSCNYFTNDWALSGVTWSEKCVHVTAKERYCIKLYY